MGLGPYSVGLMSDRNGGDLGEAILGLYWVGPVIVGLLLLLLRQLPRDEARMIARAREAGEAI